jgi:hypothetical protein
MFLADLDRSGQWLSLHFSGRVDAIQMDACLERVRKLLEGVEPGLRSFTDLSGLELMDADCAPIIGAIMDHLGEKQVASIVRVVPDPQKDIGFSLMSKFHYDREVRQMTFESLADALHHLAD